MYFIVFLFKNLNMKNYIEIQPSSEILFEVIPGASSTSILTLTSTYSAYLAFKVKTTAPKDYIVRPNQGVIKPYESVDISIILNLKKSISDKSHRFLVEVAPTELCENSGVDDLVSFWASNPKNTVDSRKLSVMIEQPKENTQQI